MNLQTIKIARLAPAPGGVVPGWLLDREAEKTMNAGYNVKRSNICDKCFVAKAVNGSCCD